jgi:hypothetical protein
MQYFKIPFGWDPRKKQWRAPDDVPSGLSCGCICHECKKPLQCVHRKGKFRSYFRHHCLGECMGALESLAHKLAKDVFARNSAVLLPTGKIFTYDRCIVERGRHGKQPDIRLIDSATERSMIVEIFYSHKMEADTLQAFQEKGEWVMEIDISNLRHGLPSMQDFEELILEKAPRTFLSIGAEVANNHNLPAVSGYRVTQPSFMLRVSDWFSENWPIVLGALLFVILVYIARRRRVRYS